jgi:hypothetical protein
MKINKHIKLLGLKAEDKVTKTKGVISSICFDLYGCIQVTITPKSKENKLVQCYWYDISRLKILSKKPIIKRPNYEYGSQAEGKQGCFDKPTV